MISRSFKHAVRIQSLQAVIVAGFLILREAFPIREDPEAPRASAVKAGSHTTIE